MNKTGKLVLGIVTILPIAYMVYFFISFFNFSNDIGNFDTLMIFHMGTMLLMLGLMIFYVVNAYNSPKLPADKRSIWVIILFFGNIIAMPIYWYQYIWKEIPEHEEEKSKSA